MANLLDYVKWRGDLSFDANPFNEVDNLILAELCFLDFAGILPNPAPGALPSDPTKKEAPRSEPLPLAEACERLFARISPDAMDLGLFVPHAIVDLALLAAAAPRFAGIGLYGYSARFSVSEEMQFAALTFRLPDGSDYIAFRGTDDTLIGWKEDLNMAYRTVIPSQAEAQAYLAAIAGATDRPLRVGGHSKGGNLAVYAAIHQPEAILDRILFVYNNDGPGFRVSPQNTPGYRKLKDRMLHLTPTRSVVGSLLSHDLHLDVLESDGFGIFQHDGFHWHLLGNRFLRAGSRSRGSLELESTLRGFLADMSEEDARGFVDVFFKILSAGGAETLSDISEEKLRSAYKMTATLLTLKKPMRDRLIRALKLFFREQNRVVRARRSAQKAEKEAQKAKKEAQAMENADEIFPL